MHYVDWVRVRVVRGDRKRQTHGRPHEMPVSRLIMADPYKWLAREWASWRPMHGRYFRIGKYPAETDFVRGQKSLDSLVVWL